jgi:hypothetical protein
MPDPHFPPPPLQFIPDPHFPPSPPQFMPDPHCPPPPLQFIPDPQVPLIVIPDVTMPVFKSPLKAELPKTPISFLLALKAHTALYLPAHTGKVFPTCAAMEGGASSLFQFFVAFVNTFLQKIWGIPNFA